jgi:hypothetical protein
MRLPMSGTCFVVSMAMFPLFATPSDAGRRDYGGRAYEDGAIVTAHSRHGNGAIDGLIRQGRLTWEVQLPSGTWIGCRRSCEETLRVQTVDFYETNGRMTGYGTLQNECGIFGCIELNF